MERRRPLCPHGLGAKSIVSQLASITTDRELTAKPSGPPPAVRDVARAHVLASTVGAKQSKRYIVSAYHISNEHVACVARKVAPEGKVSLVAPPPEQEEARTNYVLDSTPIQELGLEYMRWEQCVENTVTALWKVHDRVEKV